ncbi:MAG TPA: DivIVA domain-containing protein [Actinomycetota bacterium]|jgi:DivIVA domain-containing protein
MVLAQIESFSLRPAGIASRRFSVTGRGYDRDEVHQFLEDVADYMSRLQGELEYRRARRGPERGTIIEREDAINVVAAAREQAEKIMAEARKEAEGYVRLARAIAHQLALEAEARKGYIALAVAAGDSAERGAEETSDASGVGFEDLEVWMDASILQILMESMEAQAEPEAPAESEAASPPESSAEPEASADTETSAQPEASAETSTPPETAAQAEPQTTQTAVQEAEASTQAESEPQPQPK